MSPLEKKVLASALNTLSSSFIDYYNYNKEIKERFNFDKMGRAIMAKRMMAELLDVGFGINQYLLPGESPCEEDDNPKDWYNFAKPSTSEKLTEKEKEYLKNTLLPIMNKLSGLNDSDDACLRVCTRKIAELAGYQPIGHYRLLGETGVEYKYVKE
jgi:hypothetical protein